jgi:hypothetical protein
MSVETVASFAASDLKQSGPILDAATRGVVRITRRSDVFLLLREAQFADIMREAADPRPKTLADLLVDYDPADIKTRLGAWTADAPAGTETL